MQTIVVGVSEINKRILENSFQSFDYPQPAFANEAASALEKLEEKRFGLAITNKRLPEMTGIDFAAKLRSSEEYRYTPLLLIGEQFTHEEIVKAIQAGVNQVLLMPLTTPDLEKKINATRKMRG